MAGFDPTIQNWITDPTSYPFTEESLSLYNRHTLPDRLTDTEDDDEDDDAEVVEDDDVEVEDMSGKFHKQRAEPLRKPPSWFGQAQFKYNGRMFLAALPGLPLIFSLTGDLLIGIITIGGLITYFLHVTGATNKSFISFGLTFFICHISIIYSTLPLLWASILNLFLLMIVNSFSLLTGAWLCLQFEYFILSEPDLSKSIETLLFTFYPWLSILISSWMVGLLYSSAAIPYCVIILGFILLQMFTVPTVCSFYQTEKKPQNDYAGYVLQPSVIGSVAAIYAVLPSVFFILISVARATFDAFDDIIELAFIGSISFCLATFLNLRQFLEESDFTPVYLRRIRSAFGMSAMLLFSQVLSKYNFTIYLLPWLSVGIIIHAFFGMFVGQKQTKKRGFLSGVALIALYLFVFYKLPWNLHHYIIHDLMHLSIINIGLMINALLCVLVVYAAAYFSKEVFGLLFTLLNLVMMICEKCLLFGELYHPALLALSAILSIYIIWRIESSNTLPWQHALISSSLHVSKYGTLCHYLLPKYLQAEITGSFMVFNQVLDLALSLVILASIIDPSTNMSAIRWGSYVGTFIALLCLHLPTTLLHTYWLVFMSNPTLADLTGLAVTLVGLFCLNLAPKSSDTWYGSRMCGPTLIGLGMIMLQLQPDGSLDWVDMSKWLLMLGLVCCVLFSPLIVVTKDTRLLCAIGSFLAFPIGFTLSLWLIAEVQYISLSIIIGILTGFVADIMLISWRQSQDLERKIIFLFLLEVASCMVLLAEEVRHPLTAPVTLVMMTLCFGFTGLILKLLSTKPKEVMLFEDRKFSYLPLLGNTCCFLSFMFSCYLCPVDQWQIWYIASSIPLIFLQRDNYLIADICQHNILSPSLLVTSIVLWTSTWSSSHFWIHHKLTYVISGCIEMTLLLFILPVYYLFVTLTWSNSYYISDKWVVFLTPLCLFFFVFSSSYDGWLFAIYTFIVSFWMVKYKLPLVRHV